MSNEFELGKDCDGMPTLFRKFKGRNADSMTGREVIAKGLDDILELKTTLDISFRLGCLSSKDEEIKNRFDDLFREWKELSHSIDYFDKTQASKINDLSEKILNVPEFAIHVANSGIVCPPEHSLKFFPHLIPFVKNGEWVKSESLPT